MSLNCKSTFVPIFCKLSIMILMTCFSHHYQQTPVPSMGINMSAASSVVYTVASSSNPYFSSPKMEEPKRRFTEEKDDKIPENLLGYQVSIVWNS